MTYSVSRIFRPSIILGVVVSLVRVTWDKTSLETPPGPAKWALAAANTLSKVPWNHLLT